MFAAVNRTTNIYINRTPIHYLSIKSHNSGSVNRRQSIQIHQSDIPSCNHSSVSNTPLTINPTTPPSEPPIRVTPKIRGIAGKWKNVFINDRGFLDQSDEFDSLLHKVDGGTILCKQKHPAPPLDAIDPHFHAVYDKKLDGKQLRKNINISHLDTSLQSKIYGLIKKYWPVFSAKGQFVPVKDYSCVIDTGTARPIAVKKIHYGPREIPIMEKCIAVLEKLGHIRQVHDDEWLFKALLAPKLIKRASPTSVILFGASASTIYL
jgi:hypothetical protein